METIYWTTENAINTNSEGMDDYLSNINMLDITMVEGSYAEGVNCMGDKYSIQVSGDGDFFNHKAEFELIQKNN